MLTDAVSNTTLLAHYVRDREAAMPIELVVYKSSLAAAEIYITSCVPFLPQPPSDGLMPSRSRYDRHMIPIRRRRPATDGRTVRTDGPRRARAGDEGRHQRSSQRWVY